MPQSSLAHRSARQGTRIDSLLHHTVQFQLNERAPWLPSSRNQNRLIVAGARLPLPQNMGKRPRGAASSASGPATAKCFLGGLSQMTDSDKLVKYVQLSIYLLPS